MPFLSAVIACYSDELSIQIMYQRLSKVFQLMNVEYEIIFVNDGSPDQSKKIISNLVEKDSHVIGVHHSRNFGSQMAFISGSQIAKGDAVILFDGDQQDPPELIPEMYRKWKQGYKVVYGERISRDTSVFMGFMYKLFYRIFHSLSYIKVPVDAGDFSLIDRSVVDVLNNFSERDVFFRGLRAWVGFTQVGVPYVRPERMFGYSTNNLWKNIQWATKGIFSFSFVPLKMISFISLFTFFLSSIGIVVQVILKLFFPETPRGVTTIIIIVLFLGSIQLLSIGILGEYIAKIFEETKRRPRFVIDKIERH